MHGVCQKATWSLRRQGALSRKRPKESGATSIVLKLIGPAVVGKLLQAGGNSLNQNRLHEMDVQRPEGIRVAMCSEDDRNKYHYCK